MSLYYMIDETVPDGFEFIGISVHPVNMAEFYHLEQFSPIMPSKKGSVFGRPNGRVDIFGGETLNVYSDTSVPKNDVVTIYVDGDEKGRLPPRMVKDDVEKHVATYKMWDDGVDADCFRGEVRLVGGGSRMDDVEEVMSAQVRYDDETENGFRKDVAIDYVKDSLMNTVSDRMVSMTVDDRSVEWIDVKPLQDASDMLSDV